MASLTICLSWLLALLAAFGLAGGARLRLQGALVMAGAFVAKFGLLVLFAPQPGAIGIVTALAAGWRLLLPGRATVDLALAGICAGSAAGLYAACGLGIAPSGLLTIALVVVGMLAMRGFELGTRRDRLLCLVVPAALVVGLARELADGWRSASLLNPAVHAAGIPVPTWALILVCAAVLLGLLNGVWSRR